MHIPLSEFELHVRPEPLERGLSIYERNQVESIRSLGDGLLEAVVQDADGTWHPQLKIQKEAVVGSACKCEQGGDSLCRHAIAVVFALESGQFKEGIATKSGKVAREKAPAKGRGRLKVGEEPEAKPPKAKPPKPPKPIKTGADIVARVPHEELVAFLLQEIKIDKRMELRLKAHFADLLPATTIAEIDKRLDETLKAAQGKTSKPTKGATAVLLNRLHEWMLESGRMVEAQNYDLAFVAMDRVIHALDDLQGVTGTAAEKAMEIKRLANQMVGRLVEAQIPEPMRLVIFTRLTEALTYYFIYPPFLRLLCAITSPGQEYSKTMKLISERNDDDPETTEAQWNMVRRVKGDKAAADFERENADARFFVTNAIEAAKQAGNPAKALSLIRQAFKANRAYPGRLAHWINQELELLQAAKDQEGIVQLALRLYRQGFQTTKISLRTILDVAGKERWDLERKVLLEQFQVRKWQDTWACVALFEVDQDWEALLAYAAQMPDNVAIDWASRISHKYPELSWEIGRQFLMKALHSKAKNIEHTLLHILRLLVGLKGKPELKKHLKSIAPDPAWDANLKRLLERFDELTKYMYQRTNYGY